MSSVDLRGSRRTPIFSVLREDEPDLPDDSIDKSRRISATFTNDSSIVRTSAIVLDVVNTAAHHIFSPGEELDGTAYGWRCF